MHVVKKIIDGYCWFLNWVIAISLAVMVVLVFGNVVMRYGFNSGITLSEELSRWLFIWMTFMGAVIALKEHGHLGTDMLIGRLGPAGKKICLGLSHLLMLFTCALLFKGAYDQAVINWDTTSAVMRQVRLQGVTCGHRESFEAMLRAIAQHGIDPVTPDRVFTDHHRITVGRPVDNTQCWVLDEQGLPCGIGQEGELCLKGPSVTPGYFNAPEATAADASLAAGRERGSAGGAAHVRRRAC